MQIISNSKKLTMVFWYGILWVTSNNWSISISWEPIEITIFSLVLTLSKGGEHRHVLAKWMFPHCWHNNVLLRDHSMLNSWYNNDTSQNFKILKMIFASPNNFQRKCKTGFLKDNNDFVVSSFFFVELRWQH